MRKFFLTNKPFALLLALNVFFLLYQVNYHNLYNELKVNVKYILGEIGIEKYKKEDLKLDKTPLVLYFNMGNSFVVAQSDKHKKAVSLNTDSNLIIVPGFYSWGGGSMIYGKKVIIV